MGSAGWMVIGVRGAGNRRAVGELESGAKMVEQEAVGRSRKAIVGAGSPRPD